MIFGLSISVECIERIQQTDEIMVNIECDIGDVLVFHVIGYESITYDIVGFNHGKICLIRILE